MAERVFCIDFGSAFTKVALRRDPAATAELIAGQHAGVGEIEFCIPSTVAVDRRGTKPVAEFGDRASSITASSGIDVYHDWKRHFFHTPAATTGLTPLETLVDSVELRELAAKHGVLPAQVAYLQQLIKAAKGLIAGVGGTITSTEARQRNIASTLAPHFFHWLRQQVLDACSRLPATGLHYESIPVRIAVPRFAVSADGTPTTGLKSLLDALGTAGWPVHAERPFVTEPYSNAIGILTRATNVIQRGQIRLGEMFGKGPFVTVMKDTTHHPIYRALVIDVGAYTTDYAAVTLKPDGPNTSDPDTSISVEQESIVYGISDLDKLLIASLPAEKSEWLSKASALDWADLRPAVYSTGKGYRSPKVGVIGGASNTDGISACLTEFGKRLSIEVTRFLSKLTPTPEGALQELILTGGGCIIPTVRDMFQAAVQTNGQSFVKTHAPDLKRGSVSTPVGKLDVSLTRGGSALGGASLYFEREYY